MLPASPNSYRLFQAYQTSKLSPIILNDIGDIINGASNIVEFNGLKSLIVRGNSSAIYVHCFAYELQLTLVALAKDRIEVNVLFHSVAKLLKVVEGSCERHNMSLKVKEALEIGEISSAGGSNQEQSFQRQGDTRWGSHYRTLLTVIESFSSILDLLENIMDDDDASSEQKWQGTGLMDTMYSFDFVFILHMMRRVLGIMNDLSNALQWKDLDVLELDVQLENFIHDFSGLRGASSLAEKLVATRRNLVYPLVYRLLKLILLLPVSVERVSSAMNIVKSRLRDQTGDDWMNNCLVTYIEDEVFRLVKDESIIQRYQSMQTRRGHT